MLASMGTTLQEMQMQKQTGHGMLTVQKLHVKHAFLITVCFWGLHSQEYYFYQVLLKKKKSRLLFPFYLFISFKRSYVDNTDNVTLWEEGACVTNRICLPN